MRILITSPSTPVAFALARLLHSHGHILYAAEHERIPLTSPARYSRAYTRFFPLRKPINRYKTLGELLEAVGTAVDMWIPCGDELPALLSHEALGERPPGRVEVVHENMFDGRKETFQDFLRERVLDSESVVRVPFAFDANSEEQLEKMIKMWGVEEFEVTTAPYMYEEGWLACEEDDDTLVGSPAISDKGGLEELEGLEEDGGWDMASRSNTTPGPKPRMDTALEFTVRRRRYRLTETTPGGTYYDAHCLVRNGEIRFLITTMRDDTLEKGRFVVVEPSDMVVGILHEFTKDFISAYGRYKKEQTKKKGYGHNISGECTGNWSTHLTITFQVTDELVDSQLLRRITALSCSSKPHESLILLAAQSSYAKNLARAYSEDTGATITNVGGVRGLYSFPEILAEGWRIFRPLRLRDTTYWLCILNFLMMLFVWTLCFKEEVWCWWSPLPALLSWCVVPLLEAGTRSG